MNRALRFTALSLCLCAAGAVQAATGQAAVGVQVVLQGGSSEPSACTSSTQTANASGIVRVSCTSSEYVTVQPLPPGSAVSYGDGYRLNFDTPAVEGGNSISAQSRDIAGGADAALQAAQSQPNAQGIDAAPSQASTSDIVRQSMDGGASSMFLVRGVETGLQIRNGAMLALWIENLNAMNRLLELLVSF